MPWRVYSTIDGLRYDWEAAVYFRSGTPLCCYPATCYGYSLSLERHY
jgi:hypothetical protein